MALQIPDDTGLRGKVAVVTGGGAAGEGIGNGRAAAILLAKAGTRVVVVDREKALAQRTVALIEEAGGEAVAVEADVTRAADCAAVVQTALDRFGRLDLLDNNVGIGSRGTVIDETEENWRRVMQVNVDSMFLMAKHAIPAMRRAGGGAIVNVSSISALRPRGLTVYSVYGYGGAEYQGRLSDNDIADGAGPASLDAKSHRGDERRRWRWCSRCWTNSGASSMTSRKRGSRRSARTSAGKITTRKKQQVSLPKLAT